MRNPQFAPVRADLNRDLISIPYPLPPVIQRREGSLTNNFTRRSISQRNPVFWPTSQGEQQLMLAFGQTGEGTQPFIRLQTLDKRRRATTAQEQRPHLRLIRFDTRNALATRLLRIL